ncbi:MAG: bifunctional 5,10-methylenetetrahydrofolate dehydrogenase/5,10-methenyltetrahydrofolate cyclohydrolase, partial [Rickettsiales bacterium]
IIVQLPIPLKLDPYLILNSINNDKDVDGFHSINIGKLLTNQPGFVPATAVGCLKLIKTVKDNLSGLKAVIIGRSNIVGKPIANLLLNHNCTVTMIHSKSINIEQEIISADIIIVAIGSAKFLRPEYVKDKAIIIDVGINKSEDTIVGDVDFNEFKDKYVHITPVPGGVGPMTIACLLENTVKAAYNSKNIDFESVE